MLSRALRNTRDGILGLAYPEECRVCGITVESWDDGVACRQCWDDYTLTRILGGPVCTKCGAPLARTLTTGRDSTQTIPERICGGCSSAPFTAARACGIYSGALEASILSLKIVPHICTRLRNIILRTFNKHDAALRGDVVIPVPLHRVREKQRGFNQATLIARAICRGYALQLDDRSLKRFKATERHRAGMDANDRAQSVENAFEVVRPRLIDGASILLVDDLYTTGSTICAATHALIEAGAQRVNVLTLARVGER